MAARIRPPVSRELRPFFLLVALCSLPFWVAGVVTDLTITSQLSVASLMIVAPFAVAVVLTTREAGLPGLCLLLRRAVDPRLRSGLVWYLPVLVLMPALTVLQVILLRSVGRAIPAFELAPQVLLVDLALFWLAAMLEEVGWTGYATDRLRAHHGLIATGLILGVAWVAWHIPAMVAMPGDPGWSFIVLQCGVLVAMRMVMVWVYEGSGRSLFAIIALHAVSNVSTMTLFPVYGSHYDPLAALAVMIIVVVAVLGLPRLHRPRHHLRVGPAV